jgi:hypothetical protein
MKNLIKSLFNRGKSETKEGTGTNAGLVNTEELETSIPEWFSEGNKYGLRSDNGKIIKAATYVSHGKFVDGFASVSLIKKWGFINTLGQVVVNLKYDYVDDFVNSYAIVGNYGSNWTYGFIDKKGNEIFYPGYDSSRIPKEIFEAEQFQEGMAAVRYNAFGFSDKDWGFIDETGNLAIPAMKGIFSMKSFYNGYSLVSTSDKKGFINKSGELVIDCKFDDAYNFSEGFAPVKIEKKWGYINTLGTEVIPTKFDEAFRFENGKATVGLDGRRFCIDTNGNEIVELVNMPESVDWDKLSAEFFKKLQTLLDRKDYDPWNSDDYESHILVDHIADNLIRLKLLENPTILNKFKDIMLAETDMLHHRFKYVAWDDMGCKYRSSISIENALAARDKKYYEWFKTEIVK